MPEGLPHKVQLRVVDARHHGLPMRTPRILRLCFRCLSGRCWSSGED